MAETNATSVQSLIRFVLPVGTTTLTGEDSSTLINWAVTVRAQPPAFPDIYGGEIALVQMDVLRSLDNRIELVDVMKGLVSMNVRAIALVDAVDEPAIQFAELNHICLLHLPNNSNLSSVERSINRFILNQSVQLTERALDIQRQLARISAENQDLKSLLQVLSRATTQAIVVHDEVGVILAQVNPIRNKDRQISRRLVEQAPYSSFQRWLEHEAPEKQGLVVKSPIGFTIVLQVEKRIAGYLSLISQSQTMDEFDEMVLIYGADVCAIELAKSRAIESAVEQARGDWIQMWLSGARVDGDLLVMRAQQSGIDLSQLYLTVVFRIQAGSGQIPSLDSFVTLIKDDMSRRNIAGSAGQYVDLLVAVYSVASETHLQRTRAIIDDVCLMLSQRAANGHFAAGIARPVSGLAQLREAYREAKDAIRIATELGELKTTTYYGDLKLYQLLLGLKEHELGLLKSFYIDTLGEVLDQDNKKQSELIRTLHGFFNANGNLAKAAQDLDVHRNTLVYRLERISELTGLDLDDPDNRLILQLALKIQRVLAAVSK